MLTLDSLLTIVSVRSFCDQMVGDWLFILVFSQCISLVFSWSIMGHRTQNGDYARQQPSSVN